MTAFGRAPGRRRGAAVSPRSYIVLSNQGDAGKTYHAMAMLRNLARSRRTRAPFKAVSIVRDGEADSLQGHPVAEEVRGLAAAACLPVQACYAPITVIRRSAVRGQVIARGRDLGEVPLAGKDTVVLAGLSTADFTHAQEVIIASYQQAARDADVVVIEGAGSPTEHAIMGNLQGDLANVFITQVASARPVFVVRMDYGGGLAGLAGTLKFLPAAVRRSSLGFVASACRGDLAFIEAQARQAQTRLRLPWLGALEYLEYPDDLDPDAVADLWADAHVAHLRLLYEEICT